MHACDYNNYTQHKVSAHYYYRRWCCSYRINKWLIEVNNQQHTSTCAGLHKSDTDVLSECVEVTVTENVH